MNKHIINFKYYSYGGYCDEKDFNNLSVDLYAKDIEKNIYLCTLSFMISSITILKSFDNKKYSFINKFIDNINKIDLDNVSSNTFLANDLPVFCIEYQYDEDDNKAIRNFNNKELLMLLDNLIKDLLKDKQIETIIKAIIASDSTYNFSGAKSIINDL